MHDNVVMDTRVCTGYCLFLTKHKFSFLLIFTKGVSIGMAANLTQNHVYIIPFYNHFLALGGDKRLPQLILLATQIIIRFWYCMHFI